MNLERIRTWGRKSGGVPSGPDAKPASERPATVPAVLLLMHAIRDALQESSERSPNEVPVSH